MHLAALNIVGLISRLAIWHYHTKFNHLGFVYVCAVIL